MKSQKNVHPFWDNPRTVVLTRKGELIRHALVEMTEPKLVCFNLG